MQQALSRRGFDAAGVKETEGGPVIGFVERTTLTCGIVREHLKELKAEHLISEATPLSALLAVLARRERAFVLVGPEVRGIVTQADLNKPPVRVYLFGLVSLLEMHLEFWIRWQWPDESWQPAVKAARIERARELLSDRRTQGSDVSLLACLQFCDKADLVMRKEELRKKLGLTGRKAASRLLDAAEHLRDELAHSQSDVTGASSWTDVLALVGGIEALLQRSDECVEIAAAAAARGGDDELWASA